MSVEPSALSIRAATGRRETAPGIATRVWLALAAFVERHRARTLMAEMEDRMLKDIGITRSDIDRAARFGHASPDPILPWWRDPTNR